MFIQFCLEVSNCKRCYLVYFVFIKEGIKVTIDTGNEKSANTIKAYDKALRRFNAFLDENEIDEITPLAVADFKAELNEQGMSTNTDTDTIDTKEGEENNG